MAGSDKTVFDPGATVAESGKPVLESDATVLDDGTTLLEAALSDAAGQMDADARENIAIQKGDTILDTYRVESDVIEGGMGSVWRVHHTSWNIDLAMKRPQPKCFSTEKSKADFIHECEAWINLGLHPNIVSCYYVREIFGTPSIFSEWMDGGSLEKAIQKGTIYEGMESAQKERLLDIAIQFARGLHYAHEAGLIHQDVKPDNVLLTKEGEAKVADFGLARARAVLTVLEGERTMSEPSDGGKTMLSPSGGYTPAYCSMEQMDGKELTRRTDIYSWAVSAMEMYIGFRPWANGVVAGLSCAAYFKKARVPMPEALKTLLAQCLESEPEDRPHDFAEIESKLHEIYEAETGTAYPRPAPKAAVDTADSLNNRALSFLDLGKTDVAEKCWEQAIEINPEHSEVQYNRAIYQWHEGRATAGDTIAAVRMNFENHFGDPKSSIFLARVCLECGDESSANGYLGQAGENAEGADELRAVMKRDDGYRCEFALCRIRNYMVIADQIARYSVREKELEKLLGEGDIKKANELLVMSAMSIEYRDFAFSPVGIRLNDRISEIGYPMQVLASWRTCSCGRLAHNIAFSPDGMMLLAGEELYAARGGERLQHYGAQREAANVSAPPSYLDEILDMVKTLGGKVLPYQASTKTTCSGFDHTGSYFLRAESGERDFEMIDVTTGKAFRKFSGHIGNINSLVISADSTLILSGSDDETARLWRAMDGQCVRTLQSADGPVNKVAMSYDNRYAILSGKNMSRMFSLSNGQPVRVFDVPGQLDFCVNTRFDHLVFACGKEGLYSYDLAVGAAVEPRHHYDHKNAARGRKLQPADCVCFLPNDQHVLTGSGEMLCFWFLEQDTILSAIDCGAAVTCIATDGTGKRIAAMTTNGAQIWRNYYSYAFSDWGEWTHRLDPYAEVFFSRYPDFTERDLDMILLPELRNRGFGYIQRQVVLDAVRCLREKRQMQTAASARAAEATGVVEPLTSFENGMKIHNGLIFGYQGAESEIIVPRGTTKIGRRTFENNEFLRTVHLPYGLEEIQEGAFRGCKALEQINIPSTVKRIEREAFSGCKMLVRPVLPDGMKMDDNAF
ncbi:MAG TPA: protein kinase [Clostridia bacterium]|nr:protein kinase [Clostridia bacterium]